VSTAPGSNPDTGGAADPAPDPLAGIDLPGSAPLPDELPPMPPDDPDESSREPLLVYRGGGVGSRREARERALALLYEADAKGAEPAVVLDGLPLPAEPFAAELVAGVSEHRPEIDDLLRSYARGWTLERMPAIDRAVLRLATFELVHRPDVPTGAVISEAVELAQQYSTDESGRFVNGMLGAIAADVRADAR
jgi:N utilization substance protein B